MAAIMDILELSIGEIITPQKITRKEGSKREKGSLTPDRGRLSFQRRSDSNMYEWATEVRPRGFTDPFPANGPLTYP